MNDKHALGANRSDPRVDAWMSREFDCVNASATLRDITALMNARENSCLVVVNGAEAIGLIGEHNIVKALSRVLAGAAPGTASDILSAPPVTIEAGQSVETAAELMQARQVKRLVVVDGNGRTVGLLSQADIVRAHAASVVEDHERLEARISERTVELEAANQQLETLSRVDALMDVGNRRAMEESLAMAHQRASRYGRKYSVILLDIDHFKSFNDTYGHPRGDRVLRDVAGAITECTRMLDKVYRYGGEEVLVLLPETTEEGTRSVAERILHAVAGLEIVHAGSPHGMITVSAGIATSIPSPSGEVKTNLELLDAADQSLYKAKKAGRNRLGPHLYP